jgi:hypothetical protein
MEPIVIKKSKTLYVFHSDRLVITKKDKVIREINYKEIKEITYNPKFGVNDLINRLLTYSWSGHYYVSKAFVIDLKAGKNHLDVICMKLSNDEFEMIKDIFVDVPIDII